MVDGQYKKLKSNCWSTGQHEIVKPAKVYESYPGDLGWVGQPDDMAIADVGRLRMHMAKRLTWQKDLRLMTSSKWPERG